MSGSITTIWPLIVPAHTVPGKISSSPLQVNPRTSPPIPEKKLGSKVPELPSSESITRLIFPPLCPAKRLPFRTPPKLLAVYSSIELVFVPQVTTGLSFGPSGLIILGPRQSPSIGCAVCTGGQFAGRPSFGLVVEFGLDPFGS